MVGLNNGSFRLLISTAYTCLLHLNALPMCSVDSLLCKLGLVLIFDANVLETVELFGLDALDLKSFVFKTLSHFTSFFEVVEACLLSALGVVPNLTAESFRMVAQVHLLRIVDETLFFLTALVLLDDSEERVAFEFGLLAEHFLALHELALACNVQSLGLAPFLLSLCNFFGTFVALVLFEGALLAKGINLSLTVSGTFLQVTETLYFELLLILEFLLLTKLCFNAGPLLGFVFNDLQVLVLLLGHFFGFLAESNPVSLLNFGYHLHVAHLLLSG